MLRACCEYLASSRMFFWRVNNIPVYGRALPKFVPKGLPDIMIIVDGKFVAVECKRPQGDEEQREANGRKVRGGKLSPWQAEWATQCTLAGGHYLTVRSCDEMIEGLADIVMP